MFARSKELFQTDKLFRILVLIALISLLTGLEFRTILGSNPNNTGETVEGDPVDILTVNATSIITHTANLTSNLNHVGLASTDDLQIYLVAGVLPSSLNTTFLTAVSVADTFDNSFAEWYEDDGILNLIINNTSDESIDYRYEFRAYDEAERSLFLLFAVGTLFVNLTAIAIGAILIWWVIIPRIPFLRRD